MRVRYRTSHWTWQVVSALLINRTFLRRIISSYMSSFSLCSPVPPVKPATQTGQKEKTVKHMVTLQLHFAVNETAGEDEAPLIPASVFRPQPAALFPLPLTLLHILSPMDAECRCLCFLELKVCLSSSGVTSHTDLSVGDRSEKERDGGSQWFNKSVQFHYCV